MGIISLIEN